MQNVKPGQGDYVPSEQMPDFETNKPEYRDDTSQSVAPDETNYCSLLPRIDCLVSKACTSAARLV